MGEPRAGHGEELRRFVVGKVQPELKYWLSSRSLPHPAEQLRESVVMEVPPTRT
jgi:hypothetical protein